MHITTTCSLFLCMKKQKLMDEEEGEGEEEKEEKEKDAETGVISMRFLFFRHSWKIPHAKTMIIRLTKLQKGAGRT